MNQTEPKIVYKCSHCGCVSPELIASRECVKDWATNQMVDIIICANCKHILSIVKT
jgi:hypothetical protein